jgi:hypothetical protein
MRQSNRLGATMAFPFWRVRRKYRPGIDDPPPTTLEKIGGLLGLSALLALITMSSRRIRQRFRREGP